jgi:pimeloyl-ACP methyl ester carboxylesterase
LNVSGINRTDTIQVLDNSTNAVLYEHQIIIYRAPILMVHGLWGAPTAFDEMTTDLINSGKYFDKLLYAADYQKSNADAFYINDQGQNVLVKSIDHLLGILRAYRISAGKVDVVAHSMGGILTRMYLQRDWYNGSNGAYCYRGDIHKFITFNTPHAGTQMANFILSNTAFGADVARTILTAKGMYCNLGAVDDLRYNSFAVANLNGSRINWNIVPCYAMSTYELHPAIINTTTFGFDESTLVVTISDIRSDSIPGFLHQVFPSEASDLIVPLSSQIGGLTRFHTEPDIVHTYSQKDPLNLSWLHLLLDENPNTATNFTNNSAGFNPPSLMSNFRLSAPESDTSVYTLRMKSNIVHITSPSSNFDFMRKV